jgi:hypothetical protein
MMCHVPCPPGPGPGSIQPTDHLSRRRHAREQDRNDYSGNCGKEQVKIYDTVINNTGCVVACEKKKMKKSSRFSQDLFFLFLFLFSQQQHSTVHMVY